MEIRTLVGIEDLEIDFRALKDINDKLHNWNEFLNEGNRTLEDRGEWVKEILSWIRDAVNENHKVTTVRRLCKTSSTNAWITDRVIPFINIPLYYEERYLCGLYEYYDEEISFSNKFIYFDFLVQKIYDGEYDDDEVLEKIERSAREFLENKNYQILNFRKGEIAIKISRSTLNDYNEFKEVLVSLVYDAILLNNAIDKMYGN